jgi:hypothetical protein
MKNIAFVLTLLSTVVAFSAAARADDEASQVAYVKAAPFGRCYFKMVPDPKARYDRKRGTGYAYQVNEKGADKLLYKTTGWYARRVALTAWGRYLVRLGNWPRGRAPSSKHLGIAFYDRGKLIKRYSTKQLIKDISKVQPSVSHYTFLKKVVGFSKRKRWLFAIVTVDGKRWTFDVRTGRVDSVK